MKVRSGTLPVASRVTYDVSLVTRKGFTLIEVCVALGLAGMLMAGIFVTFQGAIGTKSVEAASEGFAAVLRATQSRALATKSFHVVYFSQKGYVVAQFMKAVWDGTQYRQIPMLFNEVDLEKENDIFTPPGNYVPSGSGVKWFVEKRDFQRAKIIAARWWNNNYVSGSTDPQDLNSINRDFVGGRDAREAYDNQVAARKLLYFLINPEGQFLGQVVPGSQASQSGDSLEIEGSFQPSFVTFASTRDLNKQSSVVITKGLVAVRPGRVSPSEFSGASLTLREDLSQ